MILDRIVQTKHIEVATLKERVTIAQFEKQIATLPQTRGFETRLLDTPKRDLGLIAEVKKASPSKGLIRADFNPVEIAKGYELAGADCLSVLTDVDYFQGSNAYLTEVSANVSLPIIRKDFIIDPFQIYEARAIGADAILLIVAILEKQQLKDLLKEAKDLSLDVLVEVHDRRELEIALELDHRLIGVNNRDLKTFHTDLQTTEELMKYVPNSIKLISESGIHTTEDVAYLKSIGAGGLLIGESFMRQPNVTDAVNALLGSIN
jgi:indole-3-glycerol phosphate synthase